MAQNSIFKAWRIGLLISTIIPFCLIIVGAAGSRYMMYTQTGITLEQYTLPSAYDGTAMRLNYLKPAADRSTTVGVILAHGFSSDRWGVQKIGISLARAGLHVAAMDYRGHGDSGGDLTDSRVLNNSQRADAYNVAADDMLTVWRFLKSQGCQYIVTVGHSMGGYTTARFAMKYPEYTNASVLLGSTEPYIGLDLNTTVPHNICFIIGAQEELFTPEMLLGTIRNTTGNTNAEIGVTYGNFSEGTARRAEIISEPGKYLGHIDELNQLFMVPTLDWINDAMQAMGVSIYYDEAYRNSLIGWMTTIENLLMVLQVGVFMLILPVGIGFSLVMLQIARKMPKYSQANMKIRDFKNIPPQFAPELAPKSVGRLWLYAAFYGLAGVTGILFTLVTKITWIPIASASYFIGAIAFQALFGILYILLKLREPEIRKALFAWVASVEKKQLKTNLLFGFSLGIIVPLGFQVFIISLGLPNLLGSLPSKSIIWIFWVGLTVLIMLALTPFCVITRGYMEAALIAGRPKKIVSGAQALSAIIIALLVTIVGVWESGISILTVAFTAGFLAVMAAVHVINLLPYAKTHSNIPMVMFGGIFLAFAILMLLPYST